MENSSIEVGDRCERGGEIVTVECIVRAGASAYVVDRNGLRWLVGTSTLTKRPDVSEADALAARFPQRDEQGQILAYFVRSADGQRGPYAYRETAEAMPRFPEERIVLARVLGRNGRRVLAPRP